MASGANLAQFVCNFVLTGSGQVTKLRRHKRYSLRQLYLQNQVSPQLDVAPGKCVLFFREALQPFVWKRQGINPSPSGPGYEK